MEPLAEEMAHAVGARLRECRKQHGFTQKDVCGRLSISTITMSLLESGKRMPNLTTLGKLAKLYGVKYDELIPEIQEDSMIAKAGSSIGTLREQINGMVEVAHRRFHYDMSYFGRNTRIEIYQTAPEHVVIRVTDKVGKYQERRVSNQYMDALGSEGIYSVIKAEQMKLWRKNKKEEDDGEI